ncbi:MAG: oligosaccharide flippase family protein [Patescibacteria group bacterium]|nr:oligosaccharide flippase family protein [Patescibacteria group bacterium]
MKKNKLNSKIAFIFVLYKTPENEIERLKKEVKNLAGRYSHKLYFIDNTNTGLGYASGVNQGIKKAINDRCDLFVIANPDISFNKLKIKEIIKAESYFDIWGLAMRQDKKIYYAGEIDKWRMSAGLITKKPKKRFVEADFVSGSLMIIKKSVIDKIGYFDESYFMYYEEVDYCYRAKKQGFKIGIDSKFIYDHFEISKNTNPKKDWYLFKNRFKFFLKYASTKQKIRELIRLPKTIFEEIKKRIFYVNFFAYNFFSILNKILTFIQFIFLIRIFPPEAYGIYSLAWAHLSLFLPLIDFGSTNFGIINLPQQKKLKFLDILNFRFFLSLLVFFLTIISLFFIPYNLKVKLAILSISVVAFQTGFFGSLLIKLTNLNKAYFSSFLSFLFQFVLTFLVVVIAFLTKDILKVFFMIFICYLIYLFFIIFYLKKINFDFKIRFSFDKFFLIVKGAYLYLLISLFARWYSRIDIFLLNFLKGEQSVGIYSSGYKFLEALMFMITAYNLSSLPIFVSFYKEKKFDLLRLKIKKDFFFLGFIGLLIGFSFYFFSDFFLGLFFKNKYLLAIPVLKIIIFNLPLILLTSIFFNFFYTIGRIRIILFLMIFQIFFNFVFNWFLIPKYSYFASAYVSVLAEIINLIVCVYFYKRFINEFN